MWVPDSRDPCEFVLAKRHFPTETRAGEEWIATAIQQSGAAHLLGGAKIDMRLYEADYSNLEFAVLVASFKNDNYKLPDEGESKKGGGGSKGGGDDDGEGGAPQEFPRILREVVVGRTPPVVHVFSVVEYGRRFYRSIIYSSNPRFSFAELQQKFDSRGTFYGDVEEKPDVKVGGYVVVWLRGCVAGRVDHPLLAGGCRVCPLFSACFVLSVTEMCCVSV